MNLRRAAIRLYWPIQRRIAPGLTYSQEDYEQRLSALVTPQTTWLDLGCGHQILPAWRGEAEKRLAGRGRALVGIDYDLPSLRTHPHLRLKVRGDIATLPFRDRSFDLVTANMVVEHIENPERQFEEVRRVLKPGGLFLLHTPNARGYPVLMGKLVPPALRPRLVTLLEGRKEEDVFETFYRANTPRSIQALSERAHLDVVDVKLLVSAAMFVVIPPLAILELLWIRLLMTRRFASLRPNLLAILKR
jgi:SAM-dependent methyltransferase